NGWKVSVVNVNNVVIGNNSFVFTDSENSCDAIRVTGGSTYYIKVAAKSTTSAPTWVDYQITLNFEKCTHSDYDSYPAKPATCTESGYEAYRVCKDCGTTITEYIELPALGHSFTNYVADGNATCTEDGTKTAKCDRCNVTDTIADNGSAHGHIAAAAVKENVVKATCTATGSYESVVYCKYCHEELSRTKAATDKTAHQIVTIKAVPATCTETGLTEGKKCSVCGEILTAQKVISKTEHSYMTSTVKATMTNDGKLVTNCTNCGEISKTVVIPKIAAISLSSTSYTYDGKVKTPTVTVKDSKKNTLKNNTDYTVTYSSGRKNPGQYAVKVTFKGNYSGSKTLYYSILPGVTSKIATAASSSAIKIAWKAVPGATGYRVYLYNTSTKKYTALKTTTATSYTATNLKSGTSYKFAVKAYTTVNGKVYWSSEYQTVTATTNPGTPTLKVTAGNKKATLSWTKQTGASGYEIYYKSGNTYKKLAAVQGGSTLKYTRTGLKTGSTYTFKVRAYSVVAGKTIYGSFSSAKSVKVK
ncbi:MAG: fibronectin type III domain-containing protein, partial [Acutalibacteraceae bacterium]